MNHLLVELPLITDEEELRNLLGDYTHHENDDRR